MKSGIVLLVFIVVFSLAPGDLPSEELKSEKKKTGFYSKELLYINKRINAVFEKFKAPNYYNKTSGRIEKLRSFSISLKSLSNIEYESGELIRVKLKCKLTFDNNDKIKRIDFNKLKIIERNGVKQIRNIINKKPLSGGLDSLYVELKNYYKKQKKTENKKSFDVFRVEDVIDEQTKLRIGSLYLNWIEDVEYRLKKINRNSYMRLKYKNINSFDL